MQKVSYSCNFVLLSASVMFMINASPAPLWLSWLYAPYSLNFRWLNKVRCHSPIPTIINKKQKSRDAQLRNYLRIFKSGTIERRLKLWFSWKSIFAFMEHCVFVRMYLRSHFGILLLSVVQSYLGFVFQFLFVRCLTLITRNVVCVLEWYLRRRTPKSSYLVEFLQMFLSLIT